MFRPKLLLPLPCLALLLLGCLSGSGDQGLVVSPAAPAVRVGEQLALQAEPLEDLSQEPEWEVQEAYGGGFLQTRGFRVTYVAPVSAGRFHLVLHATRTDGSRLKQVEEIQVLPLPQVEPAQVRLAPGGGQAFAARMKGLPRNTVLWSVEEPGGGTVDPEGNYRAPAATGTFHVKATSTLDPEVSAVATVQVE